MPRDIVIDRATCLLKSEVARFYSDVCGRAYQVPSPDGPFSRLGKAALSDGEVVGLMTGSELRPDNDGSKRGIVNLYGAVRPAWRRCGIGGRLLDGFVEECRSTGAETKIVTSFVDDADLSISRLLQRHGFVQQPNILRYARALSEAPELEKGGSFAVEVYRGGEPVTEAAIVDLYRRAYRHRPGVPRLTVEGVQEQLMEPRCAYVLVSDAGRLVGHATAYWTAADYFVESVLIARSHWGSGASDFLGKAILRHAIEEGCGRIVGLVETTNAAAQAFNQRHGLSVVEEIRRFTLNVGG
jgi:GNAT superfamily N-acetyltransferase